MDLSKLNYEPGTGVLKYRSNGRTYRRPDALEIRWRLSIGSEIPQGYSVKLKNPNMPPRLDNLIMVKESEVLPEGLTLQGREYVVKWEGLEYGRYRDLTIANRILALAKRGAERRSDSIWNDIEDTELVVKRGELIGILKSLTTEGDPKNAD